MASHQTKRRSIIQPTGTYSAKIHIHSERPEPRVITTLVVRNPHNSTALNNAYSLLLHVVRMEPVLIELEREKEDLLIIGHASVIRCLLAYLIGLPASEIPAIEIARGDLLEVVPASYGVLSHAYHFWDGPGRKGSDGADNSSKDENNFYENYAEDTKGKKVVIEEASVSVTEPTV